MKIHLLHVNDVHSQLENYMRLGHQLRSLREQLQAEGDLVLTLDLGDLLDRVRPETEATLGLINVAMMASLQVDAWVFGNNEGLTIPVKQWDSLVERARVTALASNFRELSGRPFPFFQDLKIFEQAGIRVGLFAVTANYVHPYEMLGVQALDPVTQATEMVRQLRNASCDVIVAMSHLGLHEDRMLAKRVSGINLILGSHTHQFMTEMEWVDGTAVFQPGKHALVFGHTEIDVDVPSRSIRSIYGRPIHVDALGVFDQEMLSTYRGYAPDVEQRLSETVVYLPQRLPVCFDCESVFANVLADALWHAYPCDLGLIMSGALTASLLSGRVEVGHVLGACSTPTRPLMLNLSGLDIETIVDKSLRSQYFAQQGFGYGFRGSVVGYLALANAKVELRRDDEAGEMRLERMWIGGHPLDKARTYRVVTSEYLWLAPVFEEFKRGQQVEFEQPLVREVLLDYLKSADFLSLAQQPRYLELD